MSKDLAKEHETVVFLSKLTFSSGLLIGLAFNLSFWLSLAILAAISGLIIIQAKASISNEKKREERQFEFFLNVLLGLMLSLPAIPFMRGLFSLRILVFSASLGFYHWAEYHYNCIFHYAKLNFDSKYLEALFFRVPYQSELGLHCGFGFGLRRVTHHTLSVPST